MQRTQAFYEFWFGGTCMLLDFTTGLLAVSGWNHLCCAVTIRLVYLWLLSTALKASALQSTASPASCCSPYPNCFCHWQHHCGSGKPTVPTDMYLRLYLPHCKMPVVNNQCSCCLAKRNILSGATQILKRHPTESAQK